MRRTIKRTMRATTLGLGLLGAGIGQADAGFIVSVEAAKVQASTLAGVTTESFDSYPAGVYGNINGQSSAVGTFTSPGVAIMKADSYGGAGGTGNYFAIGGESGTTSATLTLSGSQSYFGFWWSAADANNIVDLYSAGKYLGSLATANVLNSLGAAYSGNPNNGGDASEKFAYLNIYGTNGSTIDQVVFRNAGTTTGFELDNISTKASYTGAPTGTIIANGIVPEPSSLALVAIGGLAVGGTRLRNRRRAAPTT